MLLFRSHLAGDVLTAFISGANTCGFVKQKKTNAKLLNEV